MKDLGRKKVMRLVTGSVLGALMILAHPFAISNEQIGKFKNSRTDYEEVTATVISSDGNEGGQLRIYTGDCSGCFVDVMFDARTHLNTPLGHYYGLEKLVDWNDRAMNISVIEETGKAVNVRVLAYGPAY